MSQHVGLNAYDRHKKFMDDYAYYYGRARVEGIKLPVKTDQDTLRETYRFIRTEDDDDRSWEQRLAKRYYDKLFKEYGVADMSRYKENKIGLRWRVEKEVISGKGQFVCGNKTCSKKEGLHSYEVNFGYKEAGESKQALVKLRVCPRCAYKLNYRKEKQICMQLRQKRKRHKKRKKESHPSKSQRRPSTDEESYQLDSEDGGCTSDSSPGESAEYGKTGFGKVESGKPGKSESQGANEELEPYFQGLFL